jgi:hypothetical protein
MQVLYSSREFWKRGVTVSRVREDSTRSDGGTVLRSRYIPSLDIYHTVSVATNTWATVIIPIDSALSALMQYFQTAQYECMTVHARQHHCAVPGPKSCS